jgi:hypothetical protein
MGHSVVSLLEHRSVWEMSDGWGDDQLILANLR